jgi:hypothetical protein
MPTFDRTTAADLPFDRLAATWASAVICRAKLARAARANPETPGLVEAYLEAREAERACLQDVRQAQQQLHRTLGLM